jgi:hypothetical protein
MAGGPPLSNIIACNLNIMTDDTALYLFLFLFAAKCKEKLTMPQSRLI